jgi:hypothetical protein
MCNAIDKVVINGLKYLLEELMNKMFLNIILLFVFAESIYSQGKNFDEIMEKYNIELGVQLSEYDYYLLTNQMTRRITLTNNNQLDEIISLNIDGCLLDVSLNNEKIITRISSDDNKIIGPYNIIIGDSLEKIITLTELFYYNNGYLGLYAKIDDKWLIVFGENENILMKNLSKGYINKDRVFVVEELKPNSISLELIDYKNLQVKYIIYQDLSENYIYFTRIEFE